MADTLQVEIWRGDARGGALVAYEVPARKSQTVLDVVTWVQRHAEPSLAYRFACRVGMCGSCAMTVNGTPRWTCRTHVARVARKGRLRIEPLANLPLIRDLATDMAPFFEKWTRAEARHHPSASRTDPIARIDPASPARKAASAAIECINCAVCHAACGTVAGNEAYLGPAPLQRAFTLLNDARDGGHAAIRKAVAGAGGCFNCHAMGRCSALCPNGLDPMGAIAGLKRMVLRGDTGGGGPEGGHA